MKKSILFESSFFSYTVFIYSQNIPSRNDTEKAWTAVKQVANVSEAPGRCVQRKTHVGPYFCLEPQISFVILLKMSLPHNRPNKATLIFFFISPRIFSIALFLVCLYIHYFLRYYVTLVIRHYAFWYLMFYCVTSGRIVIYFTELICNILMGN